MKKHLPNFITLCNLGAGTAALFMLMGNRPVVAVALLLLAAVCDFSDGTAARLLKVTSETGKQLDSLADIVSFGVLPAAFIFTIFRILIADLPEDAFWTKPLASYALMLSVLIVPAMSAIRLARFNLQEDSEFRGLPTPAHALFWTGIFWDIVVNGSLYGKEVQIWFILIIMLLMAALMILPLPMLSFKFKSLSLRENFLRYLAVLLAVLLLIFLHLPGLPLLILLYILLSLVRIVLH